MDWYLIYSMRYQNWMPNYKKSSSKFIIKKFFLVYLVFFNINANALNGYVSIDHSATDKDWGFLPEVTNSFDYSDLSSFELMLVRNNIGLKFNLGEFHLNLERPVQPKSLALNAESQLFEFFYILDSDKSISLTFKNQSSDTQQIECYTFSSLTIGFCDEAVLSITNRKEKYDVLEDNKLMLLDAANKEIKFSYTQAVDTFFSDEYILYLAISKNEFDWLSPIEELTGGFIANLTYKGSRIGDLVTNEIKRLPQRDTFEPSPRRKIFLASSSSLISELFAIMLFFISAEELILQFSITIEFSIFDMATVVLLPTLTFGPIEEPEEI